MKEVRIRTIWHGDVGVNEEKYVKPALATGQGLFVLHVITGEVMEIPPQQVANYKARSEHKFKDKYGGPDYYLVYYEWKPTAKQAVML